MASQRFTVIATSVSGKFCSDEQDHVDMRLVPEFPNSGDSIEAVVKDITSWVNACNTVQKAGKIQGVAPIGNPPTDQEVNLPIASSEGNAYNLAIDGTSLRNRFWQAISNLHQVDMRNDLMEAYGKEQQAGGKKKVKGFVIPS